MTKLLSVSMIAAMAVLAPSVVSAQSVKLAPPMQRVESEEGSNIEIGENQAWYGYYKGNEPISGFGVGFPNIEQDVNNAIFVSGTDPICKGKTIKGLRFKIQGVGDISNISGWLSAELNVPVDENLIASVAVDEADVIDGAWTEVLLPEGYVIPEEGVYAGYSVHTTSAIHTSQFVGFTTSDRIAPDGALYNFETGFMSGWQSYGDRMGKLCYQVLLEGDFSENALTAEDFGDHYVVKGEKKDVTLKLTSIGAAGVDNFSYVIKTDGVEGEEQEVVLDEHFDLFGGSFEVEIPFYSDEKTRKAEKTFVITKVNGQPNGASSDVASASGSLVTLMKSSARKALIETYTGTWCGWCPRALVGNEKLEGMYGDDLIVIEAHVGMDNYSDPMVTAPYSELQDDRRGYPTSLFNREFVGDSYSGLTREEVFTSPSVVDAVFNSVAEGEISLTAEWTNEDKTKIKASSEVAFMYDTDDAHYGVAYVVKADGLSGEGEEWMQTSFYMYFAEDAAYAAGTELGDDFRFWLDQKEELVAGVVYNNVAVAAYGLESGLPESVSAPIIAGEKQSKDYFISLSNNHLVQDKSKLKVVAMLIDKESGRVVNAAECKVSDLTGVGAIDSDKELVKEIGRYNLLGQPISAPQPGVNVVVYSDGSVKKVIEK